MNSFGLKLSTRCRPKNVVSRLQSTKTVPTSGKPAPIEIVIPPRKERGPTDILRALEKTIKRDPTAPRYKYHDDPFLIPYSSYQKRTYALAQESGRRAAMWVRERHGDIFPTDLSNPVIEKFLPKRVFNSKEDVSEEILKDLIQNAEVKEAITVYKLLEENVSVETKQELFELLCYYNGEDPIDSEMLEEKWHKQAQKPKNWVATSEVESLFEFLKTQDESIVARAYNSAICAHAKFNNCVRSWILFEEAQKKNIPLSTRCFNSVINVLPYIKTKENIIEQKQILLNLLKLMYKMGLEPNTETLNGSLRVASFIKNYKVAKDLCFSLFTEFKKINVQPNLTSYYFAFYIFYKEGVRSPLIKNVIKEIAGKEFQIENRLDTHFFVTAMNIAANNLEDPVLGDDIYQLLLTGDNYRFIGDNLKESIFYRNYFLLQIKNQSLEDFIKLYYDLLVPNMYTPEPIVIDAILNAISVNDPEIAIPFLPRFWSHIVQFDQLDRKNIVSKALDLMRTQCQPQKNQHEFIKMFSDAAWTVWNHVEKQKVKKIQQISWDGAILGDIAILLARNDDYDKCADVISYLLKDHNSIVGILKPEQIEGLFDIFFERGEALLALNLVNYCSDIAYDNTTEMAIKVYQNFSLNEWQENRLRSLVDPNVLQASVEGKQ